MAVVWLVAARPPLTSLHRAVCVLTRADDHRGWAIFEQGVSLFVVAHLNVAQKQGALPVRLADAQAARPKVLDITGDTPIVRTVEDAPEVLLDATIDAIDAAHFTGKADRPLVEAMAAELEWVIKGSMDAVSMQRDAAARSVDPRVLREARTGIQLRDVLAQEAKERLHERATLDAGAVHADDGTSGL